MSALKDFQRRWIDIGHVPFKEKDAIQQIYRDAIDALMDKMDVSKSELSHSGFQNKIDMIKSDPDASWRLSRERNALQTKIKRIREDVAIWENNIGFFSDSKQSDLLKKEFEEKIEKAKKEIDALQSRIKLLD